MTNSKLPAYFEKYFEQKFGSIGDQISELKVHVNDEIAEIKKILIDHDSKLRRLYIIVAAIGVVFVIHDIYPGDLFQLIKSLFI